MRILGEADLEENRPWDELSAKRKFKTVVAVVGLQYNGRSRW